MRQNKKQKYIYHLRPFTSSYRKKVLFPSNLAQKTGKKKKKFFYLFFPICYANSSLTDKTLKFFVTLASKCHPNVNGMYQ